MTPISFADAFELTSTSRVAVVGSGGKTSLIFRLARALPAPVLVSNTAHLAVEQGKYADRVITVSQTGDFPDEAAGPFEGITLITGAADQRGRTQGLEGESLEGLLRLADRWGAALLIEADGSRGLALKAPAAWEPPIPDFADTVIVTAGLSGLGKPLTAEWVFRHEEFGDLSGLAPGAAIDLSAVSRVLLHPLGGLKNIPVSARRMALLNQADSPDLREQGAALAGGLLPAYQRVIVASVHGPAAEGPVAEIHAVYQRTAGIVLAAGAARRMGTPKQLLEWQGEALVRRQVRIARDAGLDPIMVVSGAYAEEVEAVLVGDKIRIVSNLDWRNGQSSSVKAGLAALPPDIGAAVFLLTDQPFVTAKIIQQLVSLHAQTLAPIIAPRVGEQRANPVLFDRSTFGDLMSLQGDSGGRQVMGKWGVTFVDWLDERLLVDIDSLEDYQRARGLI